MKFVGLLLLTLICLLDVVTAQRGIHELTIDVMLYNIDCSNKY